MLNAGAATFSAALDRDTITLGETANLALTCNGGQPQSEPAPPSVPNLQIVYIGPSSQFSVINNQVSSSITYNFRVIPRQAGDYAIPAMTVEVGGQKLTSQPLVLKVVKPQAAPAGVTNAAAQPALVKLALPKKSFYVGESLAAQLQLYLSSQVQSVEQFQTTSFAADGFNVGKMMQGQRRQIQMAGSIYTVIPINVVLTAVKAGSYTLGPMTVSLVLDIASPNRRRDPFFEQFGIRDPFFERSTVQQQVALATESEPVEIQAIPREKAPASFNGAVGNFSMNVTAGPTNLTEGDPITLKVQIAGRGSIDNLTMPDLPWSNFVVHPPEIKSEHSDQLGLQGTKTFEYIVTPQTADLKALPEIAFSFFDPDQKAFRTLTHPPFPLVVHPGGAVAVPSALASAHPRQEAPAPAQDIVPNKQRPGQLAQIGPPLIQRPWFLALQGTPVLALVASVLWRRRADALSNNPKLRRRRQAELAISQGFADLRRLAAENQSDAFFVTVFRVLQERLGERLDVPAGSITEAVIDERLRPLGVPEPTLSAVQELFQACNLARYAPVRSSQELSAFVPKVETTLDQLKQIKA